MKNAPILRGIYSLRDQTGKWCVHIPNLVVTQDFQDNEYNFKNNNEFCEWLISNEHFGYTAIAHYAQGYDSHFTMQFCTANTIKWYTIYNGSNLMLLGITSLDLKIIIVII